MDEERVNRINRENMVGVTAPMKGATPMKSAYVPPSQFKQDKQERTIELLAEINTNIKALVGAMAATDQQNRQFIAHLFGGQEKEKTPVDSFFSQGFFKE